MKTTFIFLCAFLMSLISANAQAPFETKTVSVFKNGTAFFQKEAALKTTDAKYFLEAGAPNAAFGTLWLTSPTGSIALVKTYEKTITDSTTTKKEFKSSAFGPMLSSNLNVPLVLHFSDNSALAGKVDKIDGAYALFNSTGDNKWHTIKVANIARIEFAGKPILPDSTYTTTHKNEKLVRGIELNFTSKKEKQNVGMVYLEKGIGWMPSYHVRLDGSAKAKLTLQSEVINDAEDIENAKMQFVVGVPNFIHQDQLSPLADRTPVEQALSLMQNPAQSRFMNDFANRGGSIAYGIEADGDFGEVQGTQLAGSATEDFFFYTLPKVSLKKDERAIFNVLDADIPVQHVYEAKLQPNHNNFIYLRENSTNDFSFDANFKNKVWHVIKLTNSTGSPLTAGSVMVTKQEKGEKRPISQDKITYTPEGKSAFLKLTVAPDVSIKDADKELSRIENHKKQNNYQFDLIKMQGTISVHNQKDKAIALNIRREIAGKLEKTSAPWLEAPRLSPSTQLNEVTDVCWELELKAGEQMTVTYEYAMLVRKY